MRDELRRLVLFTSGVAELTRYRAEQLVKSWVGSGDLKMDQASSMVRQLLEISKTSRKELLRFIRAEVEAQVESLGLATRRDIERLERRIARVERDRDKSTRKKTSTTRSGSSKKTTAKKSASTTRSQG